MSNQAVIGLAMLKVHWDEKGTDYIANFVPLLAECIRISSDEIVSANVARENIGRQFGLNIPINVVETIIKRARREGYLIYDSSHHVYKPNRRKLDQLNFRETQQAVIEQHEKLVSGLLKFCLEQFNEQWSEKKAEDALLAYLDEYQLNLLSRDRAPGIITTPKGVTREAHFFVGTYIKHLQDTGASELYYLDTVLMGNFLANAIFLPDTTKVSKTLNAPMFTWTHSF